MRVSTLSGVVMSGALITADERDPVIQLRLGGFREGFGWGASAKDCRSSAGRKAAIFASTIAGEGEASSERAPTLPSLWR
jgi:hypothetical protein